MLKIREAPRVVQLKIREICLTTEEWKEGEGENKFLIEILMLVKSMLRNDFRSYPDQQHGQNIISNSNMFWHKIDKKNV